MPLIPQGQRILAILSQSQELLQAKPKQNNFTIIPMSNLSPEESSFIIQPSIDGFVKPHVKRLLPSSELQKRFSMHSGNIRDRKQP